MWVKKVISKFAIIFSKFAIKNLLCFFVVFIFTKSQIQVLVV